MSEPEHDQHPIGISISPDDRFVYVTDVGNHSIHVRSRNSATGALGETQCLSDLASPPTGCTSARVIGDVQSVVISPDGLHAYSAQFGDGMGLAIFHVGADGGLTQLPGSAGYITLTGEDNTNNPTCATGRALQGPYGVTISPDDRTLYVTELTLGLAEEGVAIFSLDPATGAATQLPGAAGCLTVDGASNGVANACGFATALGASNQPVISSDGRSVYVASEGGQSVTSFNVESGPVCQTTTASTGYQTPVTVSLSCTDRDGDPVTPSISSAPAHGTLGTAGSTVTYTPAAGYTGTDTFSYQASDGTNASAPATATIAVSAPPAPPFPPTRTTPAPKLPVALTHVTQAHRSWHEGKHGGTTFTFTLNQPATVILTFTQRGHTRTLGRLSIAAHAGKNKLAFNGRINHHTNLKPGTYTVTIKAGGSTQRLTFTILK